MQLKRTGHPVYPGAAATAPSPVPSSAAAGRPSPPVGLELAFGSP